MSLFLTLRVLHFITGVFWAGSVFFLVSFLMPSLRDAGPDGAKVFAALRARRVFNWTPVVAFISVASGTWLYVLRIQMSSDWARGREAMVFGLGMVASILALVVGLVVMRSNSLKAADLGIEAGAMPAGAERDAKVALAQKLRVRAMMGGRAVATLLLFTVVTMAIAKYV